MNRLAFLAWGLLCAPLLAGAQSPQAVRLHGLHEKVHIVDLGHVLDAKLDTGAESASLSAYDIRYVERDGDTWVQFRPGFPGAGEARMMLPLRDRVRIRQRADVRALTGQEASERPVVTLTLCLGDRAVPLRVNLADRRQFEYPLLLGSEGLRALEAVVDPAQRYVLGTPSCQEPA